MCLLDCLWHTAARHLAEHSRNLCLSVYMSYGVIESVQATFPRWASFASSAFRGGSEAVLTGNNVGTYHLLRKIVGWLNRHAEEVGYRIKLGNHPLNQRGCLATYPFIFLGTGDEVCFYLVLRYESWAA